MDEKAEMEGILGWNLSIAYVQLDAPLNGTGQVNEFLHPSPSYPSLVISCASLSNSILVPNINFQFDFRSTTIRTILFINQCRDQRWRTSNNSGTNYFNKLQKVWKSHIDGKYFFTKQKFTRVVEVLTSASNMDNKNWLQTWVWERVEYKGVVVYKLKVFPREISNTSQSMKLRSTPTLIHLLSGLLVTFTRYLNVISSC